MLQFWDYCWDFEWNFWCYCIIVKCFIRLNILMSHLIKCRIDVECFMKLNLHFCIVFFVFNNALNIFKKKSISHVHWHQSTRRLTSTDFLINRHRFRTFIDINFTRSLISTDFLINRHRFRTFIDINFTRLLTSIDFWSIDSKKHTKLEQIKAYIFFWTFDHDVNWIFWFSTSNNDVRIDDNYCTLKSFEHRQREITIKKIIEKINQSFKQFFRKVNIVWEFWRSIKIWNNINYKKKI